MSQISNAERLGEIAAIRAKLKARKSAQSELQSAINEALSAAGIRTAPEIASSFIIALPEEISENLNNVILPGGTNCS